MSAMDSWPLRLLILLMTAKWSGGQQLCSVFQPFKVTPDNAKFQIGGPFPLHTEDCLHVRPDVVQELIGVQWALSRWNQNPQNANFKLALSAFDTCSRGQESLTQTISFLHESGFFNPKECRPGDNRARIPLGLIMPMAQDGRLKGLKEALMSIQVPIIAYSGATAQALFDANLETVFSTAPTLDHYVKAAIGVLRSIQSDLITVIYSEQHISKVTLDKQLTAFSKAGISHSKAKSIADAKSIDSNGTEIFVMIASKDEMINYFMTNPQLSGPNLKNLFVLIPALGETWNRGEMADFLMPNSASYRAIAIQQSNLFPEDDFRDYFLDILRNNYETYVLLATYMQQEHNCTLIGTPGMTDCEDVDFDDMVRGFRMNRQVESAVLATYIYGALGKHVAEDLEDTCGHAGPACTRFITDFLKEKLAYTFGEADPPSYRGFVARFGPDRSLNALPVETLYVRREADIRVESVLNHTVDAAVDPNRINSAIIRWSDGEPIRARCQSWRPECQRCADGKKYSLVTDRSWIQKSSELYVMGLFDMRRGLTSGSCNRSIDDAKAISMPAAFAYTLENMRTKYANLNLLPGVEIGGILLDSCSDRISAMETVMAASSDRCLVIGDAGTSVSIPSKNVAAIASGQSGVIQEVVKRIFERGANRKPFIGSNFESLRLQSSRKSESSGDFMPTYDAQAKVLLSVLQKQGWDYVSVLLSEHDEDCLRGYESFRRLAESEGRVCIADVVYARSGERIESIRSANAPITKIAIAFTTAQDTILMLKTHQSYRGRSQDDANRPIYIFMGDSHDWEVEAKQQSGARSWKSLALGALSVQYGKEVGDSFRNYLTTLNPKTNSDQWFISFWEDYFKCSMKTDTSESAHKKVCTGEEKLSADRLGGRLTQEAYFMSAIENFIFSLDSFYKKACPAQEGLCDAFFSEDYAANVTEIMSKVDNPYQYTIYNYRPDVNNVNGGAYVEIASWSSDSGLKFNDTWVWFSSERTPNYTVPESKCRPPSCHCRLNHDVFMKSHRAGVSAEQVDASGSFQIKSSNKNDVEDGSGAAASTAPATRDQWKKQLWTYIFLTINTILLVAASVVLTIVSVKLCCGIVRGNQSLGICLLFGVILLYISAYFFIFDACETLCRLRYIAHSFSYSVCFGVMIAKAVQLRNSETLGFNGYISYWNYWLLLFFIAAVQMALSIQWAIVRHPVVVSVVADAGSSSPTVIMRCSWSNDEFLASQIYVIILLCMASFLALLNRNVKRNYKETRWLMYTSFLCAGIWVAWMIGYAVTPEPFKDTVVVMELMICATVILCFMFGPKLYILLRYESMLSDSTPNLKLPPTGPGYGTTEHEKRNSVAMAVSPRDDVGIREFDADEEEDDRHSAISVGSIKSAKNLSNTISSASSVITCSEDSSSPVYQISRKKNRSKRRIFGADAGSADGSGSRQSNTTIFEETVSSSH